MAGVKAKTSSQVKKKWVKPELTQMKAGGAEGANGVGAQSNNKKS